MYDLINKVKEKSPLVVHYTNEVTINDCANITLALGGSPLMSYSIEEVEEVEEVVSISDAVVINIGTMNSSHLDLFIKAGKAANKFNKKVVLDPVGVFATKTRSDFIKKLLSEVKFDVIKGNTAEIKYIAGLDTQGKGVDSFDNGEDISEMIKDLSKKLNCVVASTGKIDFISDGDKVVKIYNGVEKLKSITGAGCMTSSLVGSYIGASENVLEATAMGILTMSLGGELANTGNPLIGTFKENLMNSVYDLTKEKLVKYGKVD